MNNIFRRPHCPSCGTTITYWRCWESSFPWQKWLCIRCSATLRWSIRRRLVLAIGAVIDVLLIASADEWSQIALGIALPWYAILICLAPIAFLWLFERAESVDLRQGKKEGNK